ncbi:hypothetical protein [Kribbella sp. NPDC055071]
MTRWLAAGACLMVALSACTTNHDAAPTPTATTPVPRLEPSARTTDTPTPTAFRYIVNDLELALPATYGRTKLTKSTYQYPPPDNWKPRADPLSGHTVVPRMCEDFIRFQGVPGVPGDFIAPTTPSAAAAGTVGSPAAAQIIATITELPAALGDRLLDQRLPAPAECAHITVDGREAASVVERSLPGFGVRARYIVRTYPLGGKTWTERTLQYRTDTYVALIRIDAYANPEANFLAFARKTQDGFKILQPR